MKIFENYSLKAYNTFDIDVNCRYFVESDKHEEFLDFVSFYDLDSKNVLVLGAGSDFLFTEDFDGIVFYPQMKEIDIIYEDGNDVLIRAGAGLVWDDLVNWTVEHGFYGLENLSYIPGHVGAAPVQNVGAYGVEAGDSIEKIEAVDMENACSVEISKDECQFAYRNSKFKNEWKNRFIITYVCFKLSKKVIWHLDYGTIRQELEASSECMSLALLRDVIIKIRRAKLPDVKEVPNAGSFFKNPIVRREDADKLKAKYAEIPVYDVDEEYVKLSAAWMIDSCAWKGKTIGNAGVYEKQALVLVNRGGAKGNDIVFLANEIKKTVFLKFGVLLEPEVYVY